MFKELVIAYSVCGELAELLDERYPGVYSPLYVQLTAALRRYVNEEEMVVCADDDLRALLSTLLQSLTKQFALPKDLIPLRDECFEFLNQSEYDFGN